MGQQSLVKFDTFKAYWIHVVSFYFKRIDQL